MLKIKKIILLDKEKYDQLLNELLLIGVNVDVDNENFKFIINDVNYNKAHKILSNLKIYNIISIKDQNEIHDKISLFRNIIIEVKLNNK